MIQGANVLIDVRRLVAGSGQRLTPASQPYLQGEPARVSQVPQSAYLWLSPDQVQKSLLLFAVEVEVDIVEADQIIKIVEISDEVTVWPRNSIWPSPNESWLVIKVIDREPPLVPERWVFVDRSLLGGPLHRT